MQNYGYWNIISDRKDKIERTMAKTTKFFSAMLETNKNIVDFINANEKEFCYTTFSDCLNSFLNRYQVKKADVINRSYINQIYGYQIFAGTKNPSRDKIISLMIAFPLSVSDGNTLLKSAKMAELYSRDKRDAVFIFALNNKLPIEDVNELLFSLNIKTLTYE